MLPQPHTRNTRRLSHAHGLGSSPFAHHYSGNHNCFLFLRVLRCFTSPRPHQPPYTFRRRRHPITSARLPHSETPGSKSGCRLPEAYRRLPRPSSDPDAKASTVRPQQLENTTNKKQDARVHYTKLKKQTTPHHQPPTRRPPAQPAQENTPTRPQTPQHTQETRRHPTPENAQAGPVSSGPNSVPTPTQTTPTSHHPAADQNNPKRGGIQSSQCSTHEHPPPRDPTGHNQSEEKTTPPTTEPPQPNRPTAQQAKNRGTAQM